MLAAVILFAIFCGSNALLGILICCRRSILVEDGGWGVMMLEYGMRSVVAWMEEEGG